MENPKVCLSHAAEDAKASYKKQQAALPGYLDAIKLLWLVAPYSISLIKITKYSEPDVARRAFLACTTIDLPGTVLKRALDTIRSLIFSPVLVLLMALPIALVLEAAEEWSFVETSTLLTVLFIICINILWDFTQDLQAEAQRGNYKTNE